MIGSVGKFLNYCKTFLSLSVGFLKNQLAWLTFCMFGIAIAGTLYPIPLALIATAVFAAVNGKDVVAIDIAKIDITLSISQALTIGLTVGVVAYALNFIFTRFIIRANINWQDRVYWRLANSLSGFAQFNRTVTILPFRLKQLQAYLARATTACTQIGRLITHGFHSSTVLMMTSILMLYIDWRAVAILFGSFVLLIPLYAKALFGIVSVRAEMLAEKIKNRPTINNIIEQVSLQLNYNQIPFDGENRKNLKRFSSIYSIVNNQYFSLNTIHLLVGLHFFLAIVAVFIFIKPHIGEPNEADIILFAALLIFVRTVIGVVHLMGNLTRNYTNIALLKQMLKPKGRSLQSENGRAGQFIVKGVNGKSATLAPGDIALLRSLKPSFSYQLSAITNASILIPPSNLKSRNNLIFIPTEALPLVSELLHPEYGTNTHPPGNEVRFLEFEIDRDPDHSSHSPVICIRESTYKIMKNDPKFSEILSRSVIIIWVRFGGNPDRWPDDTTTVVLDLNDTIQVTRYAEVKNHNLNDYLPANRQKNISDEDEDEDID